MLKNDPMHLVFDAFPSMVQEAQAIEASRALMRSWNAKCSQQCTK
jgi:hypothetical protein